MPGKVLQHATNRLRRDDQQQRVGPGDGLALMRYVAPRKHGSGSGPADGGLQGVAPGTCPDDGDLDPVVHAHRLRQERSERMRHRDAKPGNSGPVIGQAPPDTLRLPPIIPMRRVPDTRAGPT